MVAVTRTTAGTPKTAATPSAPRPPRREQPRSSEKQRRIIIAFEEKRAPRRTSLWMTKVCDRNTTKILNRIRRREESSAVEEKSWKRWRRSSRNIEEDTAKELALLAH
ncbi:hypothetical protein Q1695_015025 [Nippostrongylus brasiliensis]|nr:hypothetical protein Q1695_015025 [Nippostrongylus brasiliensis]